MLIRNTRISYRSNPGTGILVIIVLFLCYQFGYAQQVNNGVKPPKMAYAIEALEEGNGWSESRELSARLGSNIEYLPVGKTKSNYDEMVTLSFGHGSTLAPYLQKWLMGMKIVGAEIKTRTVEEENCVLVSYKTKRENGIWKFTQGEDGTYGVGYSFDPTSVNPKNVEQWVEEIRKAKLSK